MRALLAVLLLVAGAAQADQLANLPGADRQAIQQVITNQIDAFRRDDDGRAFGYASPGIQFMFGNAERFMEMVRQGYQPGTTPVRWRLAICWSWTATSCKSSR